MAKRIFVAILLLACLQTSSALAAPLQLGEWVGWLKFEGQQSKYAVKLDTILYQPKELTEFPRLQMIFRVGLGGFGSSEYFSQHFETVNYDFEHGNITLDSEDNDLVMALVVDQQNGFIVMHGSFFSRSSATPGTIVLKYLSDEPPEEGGVDPTIDPAPYAPTLSGQYEGKCDGADAVFQIEAARGLGDSPDSLFPGLKGYTVNATLGNDDAAMCSPTGIAAPGVRYWCTQRAYSSGEFNVANGSLLLGGWGGTPACTLKDGALDCEVNLTGSIASCQFQRTGAANWAEFSTFPRAYNVSTTAEQRRPLPAPSPPLSTDLVQALTGSYAGYLHHEKTDLYQPVRLNVLSSVSSENPHNPNMVYISGAIVFQFNAPSSPQPLIWSQRFDRKAFYLAKGFTLDDHNSDSFIQIEQWKAGSVVGSLYSRQFGRVGTIQLVKGAMPSLNAAAKLIPNPLGEFTGPIVRNPNLNRFWSFQTVSETQVTERSKSTLSFKGELFAAGGILPRRGIAKGSYDFFTQSIAFGTEEDSELRIYTGHLFDWGMGLVWPGAPHFGIGITDGHDEGRYERQ